MTLRRPTETSLWTPWLLIVSITLFLGAMVPNLFVLAPRFLGARGYDEAAIGWIMGAFNLCSLVVYPLIGWGTTRIGHARVLALGNAVFGTAPLGLSAWLVIVPFAIAMLLLDEARKAIAKASHVTWAVAPGTKCRPMAGTRR